MMIGTHVVHLYPEGTAQQIMGCFIGATGIFRDMALGCGQQPDSLAHVE